MPIPLLPSFFSLTRCYVASTAVNAATLAVIDAGIPIVRLPAAVTIGWNEGSPVVDLLKSEEEVRSQLYNSFCFSFYHYSLPRRQTLAASLTLACSWGGVAEALDSKVNKEGEEAESKPVAGGVDLMVMTGEADSYWFSSAYFNMLRQAT